ncbi:MAG: transcriptional repressor [Methylobacterium sp.]|nr:MAG: transcriptional repressor [Methylobacterium sp.]
MEHGDGGGPPSDHRRDAQLRRGMAVRETGPGRGVSPPEGQAVHQHHHHHQADPAAGARWSAHAEQVLRDAGLRTGGGRAAVIGVLAGESCVLAAHDIVDRLREQGGPGANLATVYRTLDTLRALQLVHRLDPGDGTARYERAQPDGEHHHHVLFADGTIEPFHDDALEVAIHALADRLGVDLVGHDIVLHAERRTA